MGSSFFDIRPEDSGADPWNFTGRSDDIYSLPGLASEQEGRCGDSAECASGWICVDGTCVQPAAGSGSSSGSAGCGSGSPGGGGGCGGNWSGGGCSKTGCGGLGGGASNGLDCCGGKKCCQNYGGEILCFCGDCPEDPDFPDFPIPDFPLPDFPDPPDPIGPGGPPPFPPPLPFPPPRPPKGCNDFCSGYNNTFGSPGPGCSGGGGCSQCETCVSGRCVPADNPPCYCDPSKCGDCERCLDNGSCQQDCSTCDQVVRVCVDCKCGPLCDNCFVPGCGNHQASIEQCRTNLKSRCDERCPPPPPDPCKDDPNDPCARDCRCVTRCVPCDSPRPDCPFGRCHQLGFISTCSTPGGQKCYIDKVCSPTSSNAECGCFINGCGDCEICHPDGKCRPDPDCDNLCTGTICGGNCCPDDAPCVTGRIYSWNDKCHGGGGSFISTCPPQLVHQASISTEDAVCHRAHTHCSIIACGCDGRTYTVGTHLDCGAGIQSTGGSATCCGSSQ